MNTDKAPLTTSEWLRADNLTMRFTAFDSFRDLIDAKGGYRPSIYGTRGRTPRRELANFYDRAQAARGDNRRAYRG